MTVKTLLITGASRGIGAATAVLAAQRGWDVAVNYTRDAAAAEARRRARARLAAAGRWWCRPTCPTKPQVLAMFATVDRELGPLGGLVNNAGVVDQPARVDQMSLQRLTRMFAINLTGSFLCAREAVKRMSTRHGGRGGVIVNLSSAAARLGSPGQYVDYAAAKAGIDTFTLGLAREVATEGIRVNAVRPGIIDTEIHASGGLPDRVAQVAPSVPMQRAGTRRGNRAGHRLAAVRRIELHHRRGDRRHRRALTPTRDQTDGSWHRVSAGGRRREEPLSCKVQRIAPGGTRQGLMLAAVGPFGSDCTAVLAPGSWRITRYALTRFARTYAASQITKRAGARRPRCCVPRRRTNRPCRVPPVASSGLRLFASPTTSVAGFATTTLTHAWRTVICRFAPQLVARSRLWNRVCLQARTSVAQDRPRLGRFAAVLAGFGFDTFDGLDTFGTAAATLPRGAAAGWPAGRCAAASRGGCAGPARAAGRPCGTARHRRRRSHSASQKRDSNCICVTTESSCARLERQVEQRRGVAGRQRVEGRLA